MMLHRVDVTIDGFSDDSTRRETLPVRSPATGEVVGQMALGTPADVEMAVTVAAIGAKRQGALRRRERADLVFRVGQLIDASADDLATCIASEQGKPIAEARGEVVAAVRMWKETAEIARHMTDELLASDDSQWSVIVRRNPHGVLAAITPWNFPLSIPSEYLAAGLAMGNAVILKPSELTPISAAYLVDCVKRAGFPEGAVSLVPGLGATVGPALVSHPGVNAVGFTGSPQTGMSVAQAAGPKPMLLELGGNNATVVLADVDIDRTAQRFLEPCYFNAGQVCGATERIIVERPAYEALADALASQARTLKLGQSLDEHTTLGPLNNEATASKVDRHIADAVAKGAAVLTGGGRVSGYATNLYYEATVLKGLEPSMDAFKEETFGPVAMLMPFDTEDEAVNLVNGHQLGLVAGVLGEDLDRATRIARRLATGSVNVGQVASYWQPHTPFGGFSGRHSGVGRLGGRYTLEALSQVQTFVLPEGRLP